jgi:hypothetical protein
MRSQVAMKGQASSRGNILSLLPENLVADLA